MRADLRPNEPIEKGSARQAGVALFCAGLLVGSLLVAMLIREADGDPFVLVAVSNEEEFPRTYIEAEIGRPVAARPGLGHDGQPFFLQSLDPFYRNPRTSQVDNPIYRGQRVIYPLLAGFGGLLPLRLVPWGMAIVQVLTFGFGAWATGEAAADRGLSRLWGMAFPLNPGTWAALQVGGASSLAFAFAVAAVVTVQRRHYWTGAFLLVLSALTREVMLAVAVGVFVQEWRRSGVWRVGLIALPAGMSAIWGAYLRLQIDGTFPAAGGALALPFDGLIQAFRHWSQTPTELIFGLVTVLAAVLVGIAALFTSDLLAAAAAPFAVLVPMLAIAVLRENFDYSRALIPLYTVCPLVVAAHYRTLDLAAPGFWQRGRARSACR